MKKIVAVNGRKSIAASIAVMLLGTLAGAFWLATTPSGLAQDGAPTPPPQCSVCHKRLQTLTFPCNSLEYRRHLDHGDAQRACEVTPVTNP